MAQAHLISKYEAKTWKFWKNKKLMSIFVHFERELGLGLSEIGFSRQVDFDIENVFENMLPIMYPLWYKSLVLPMLYIGEMSRNISKELQKKSLEEFLKDFSSEILEGIIGWIFQKNIELLQNFCKYIVRIIIWNF